MSDSENALQRRREILVIINEIFTPNCEKIGDVRLKITELLHNNMADQIALKDPVAGEIYRRSPSEF